MKRKGSRAERELMQILWGIGYASMRAAGSGSTRFPCPDLLASNSSRVLAIECKTTSLEKQYIKSEQLRSLVKFANQFKAEPIIALKKGKNWFFFSPDDLEQSKGGNFVITPNLIINKAKLLIDLEKEKW